MCWDCGGQELCEHGVDTADGDDEDIEETKLDNTDGHHSYRLGSWFCICQIKYD